MDASLIRTCYAIPSIRSSLGITPETRAAGAASDAGIHPFYQHEIYILPRWMKVYKSAKIKYKVNFIFTEFL